MCAFACARVCVAERLCHWGAVLSSPSILDALPSCRFYLEDETQIGDHAGDFIASINGIPSLLVTLLVAIRTVLRTSSRS